MEAMRESWTDDRLDYLNHKVDDGFKHVDERFGHFEKRVDERRRLDEGFKQVNKNFKQVDERLARMESRGDHLSKNFLDLGKSIDFSTRALIATLVIGFLTIVVTKL
jgi:Chordopoxvirus multifunctional envelope protein A27